MTAYWNLRWLRKGDAAGGIDCAGVMERLYEYIDEELEDEELEKAIRAHLKMCKKCFPHYEFEKAFLRFLSERGRYDAPPELRRKIFQRILEEESRA